MFGRGNSDGSLVQLSGLIQSRQIFWGWVPGEQREVEYALNLFLLRLVGLMLTSRFACLLSGIEFPFGPFALSRRQKNTEVFGNDKLEERCLASREERRGT